jgi:hypothetical protein
MLGAVGVGAVGGAVFLPSLKSRLGADAVVAAGTAGTALVLVVFALLKRQDAAVVAGMLAGASWIAVLSTLNVSAQVALPDWVRARGLSIFIAVFFGAMTLGSLLWGQLASAFGISATLLVAAAGAVLGAVVSWPAKLLQGAALDLSPSSHWPEPLVGAAVDHDRGPVLVTVEYRVEPATAAAFVAAMGELAAERRRGGAYAWGLFEDVAEPGRYIEYFTEESWVAHLRHHTRISAADRAIQDGVRALHRGPAEPRVTHYLAPDPGRASATLAGDGELQ